MAVFDYTWVVNDGQLQALECLELSCLFLPQPMYIHKDGELILYYNKRKPHSPYPTKPIVQTE